jgi:hypothetical protein
VVALLGLIEKMPVWLRPTGWKILVAIAVAGLLLASPNGGLAAHGRGDWQHRFDSATAPLLATGSISGYVWYDDNGNGVQGEIEGGMGRSPLTCTWITSGWIPRPPRMPGGIISSTSPPAITSSI